MTTNDRTVHRNAATHAAMVRLTEALRPFGLVAMFAGGALAVANVVLIVFGLGLTQHQVLYSVVGSYAVDVVNNLAPSERAADVVLHDQAVDGVNAALTIHDEIPTAQGAVSTFPRWGFVPVGLFLLLVLARLGARRGVGLELRSRSSDRRTTYRARLGNLGHTQIIPQLQEV